MGGFGELAFQTRAVAQFVAQQAERGLYGDAQLAGRPSVVIHVREGREIAHAEPAHRAGAAARKAGPARLPAAAAARYATHASGHAQKNTAGGASP